MKPKRSLEEIRNPLETLPGIVAEYSLLKHQIVAAMGEITPEVEQALEITEVALRTKVDSYHYVDEMLEADAAFFKRKADAFSALAKRFSNAQDRLRGNMKLAMQTLKLKEVKGKDYRWTLKRNAPKLVIDDASLLPEECVVQTVETKPDKDKIKSLLKDGHDVPGARLEEVEALQPYENVRDDS